MMMHVMFVDVHFVDKWGDHDCDVVREIIRVNVTLVSCPAHVAPGVTAQRRQSSPYGAHFFKVVASAASPEAL
jgi:hypothetical protein